MSKTLGKSGRITGSLLLLAILAVAAVLAANSSDLKRYLRIRNM